MYMHMVQMYMLIFAVNTCVHIYVYISVYIYIHVCMLEASALDVPGASHVVV